MHENEKRTELLVGAFVALGLALLGGLILVFGRVGDVFRDTYRLQVEFPSASGIVSRTEVRLGGAKVGKVAGKPELNPTFDGVTLEIEIYDSVRIPEGSEFRISTSGLLGDAYVDIVPPAQPEGGTIAPGSTIRGSTGGGLSSISTAAENLSAKAMEVMDDLRGLVERLNKSLDSINEGVLAEDNIEAFRASLRKVNSAITRLDEGVLSEDNVGELREALASIKSAGERINEAAGEIKPFLDEGREAIGRIGPAVEKVEGTAEAFTRTADSITEMADTVREGEGLASALLADPELKADFAALIENLRRHGILFYRDSAPADGGAAAGADEESASSRSGGPARRPGPPSRR